MRTASDCPCESGLDFFLCCGSPGLTAASAHPMARLDGDGLRGLRGTPTGPVVAAADALTDCPDLFLAATDFESGQALLLKMSPRWYRDSVFLDLERVRGTYGIETDLAWLADIATALSPPPVSLIFHSAFCGSTLMTQALDATHHCLPLREPHTLGQLRLYLEQQPDRQQGRRWLDSLLRLHGRTYSPQQRAVLKPRDNDTQLLLYLADWRRDIPVLFMYTPLREFVAACLRADNRREWVRTRFAHDVARAASYLDLPPSITCGEQDPGVMAALCWSLNIRLYLEAHTQSDGWLACLDFNAMLDDPPAVVARAGTHLGLEPLPDIEPAAALAPLLDRYSKNPAFRYDASARAADIDRVLDSNPRQLARAEESARQFLGGDYPGGRLPGHLL